MKHIKPFCIITLIAILCLFCLAACKNKSENTPLETDQPTDTVQKEETGDADDTEPISFDDIGDGPYFVPLKSETSLGEDAADEEKEWYEIYTDAACEYVWEENSVSAYSGGSLIQKYEFDNRGIITKSTYFNDGKITFINEYDENGNLVSNVSYYDGEVRRVELYEHDDGGNLTKVTAYDQNIDKMYELAYEYDENGNLTAECEVREDWELKVNVRYEYDENGNKTKTEEYNIDDDSVRWQTVYEYDGEGNMISMVSHNSDESVSESYSYEYDTNGNLTKYTAYGSGGSIWKQTIFEYSENKKYTKNAWYDKDRNVKYYEEIREEYDFDRRPLKKVYCEGGDITESYEYKYDEYGNLTEKISFTIWGGTHISYYTWTEATPAQYKFYIKGIENNWHTMAYSFGMDRDYSFGMD